MDHVFLDANVLFSAAYRATSRLRDLWGRKGTRLLTSAYAIEEARRNLDEGEQREALDELLSGVEVVPEAPARPLAAELAEKDRPILAAAAEAGATHLLTGDLRDFGPLLGKVVDGVRVMVPAGYLGCSERPTTRQPRVRR